MEKGPDADHVVAHLVGELSHLLSDVREKSVGFPSADEHDHVSGDASQNHGHSGRGTH